MALRSGFAGPRAPLPGANRRGNQREARDVVSSTGPVAAQPDSGAVEPRVAPPSRLTAGPRANRPLHLPRSCRENDGSRQEPIRYRAIDDANSHTGIFSIGVCGRLRDGRPRRSGTCPFRDRFVPGRRDSNGAAHARFGPAARGNACAGRSRSPEGGPCGEAASPGCRHHGRFAGTLHLARWLPGPRRVRRGMHAGARAGMAGGASRAGWPGVPVSRFGRAVRPRAMSTTRIRGSAVSGGGWGGGMRAEERRPASLRVGVFPFSLRPLRRGRAAKGQ